MKAILKFDLPEEMDEHQAAIDGWKWRGVVMDVFSLLRESEKYQDKDSLPIDEIRQFLAAKLEEYNLEL